MSTQTEQENIVSLERIVIRGSDGTPVVPDLFPDHWTRQVTLVVCKASKIDRKAMSVTLSFKRKQTYEITVNSAIVSTLENFYRFLCENYRLMDERFILWANLPNHPGPIYEDIQLQLAMQMTDRRTRIIAGTLNVTFQRRLGIGITEDVVGPVLTHIYQQQCHTSQATNPVDAILDREEAADLTNRSIILRDAEAHPVNVGPAVTIQDRDPYARNRQEMLTAHEMENISMCYIPVWTRFANELLTLNGLFHTLDVHMRPRGRSVALDHSLIRELVEEIMVRHTPLDDSD